MLIQNIFLPFPAQTLLQVGTVRAGFLLTFRLHADEQTVLLFSGLVRSNFNSRLNELLKLELIKVEYDREERKPLYSLTPKGKRILEHMEEIEKIYKE